MDIIPFDFEGASIRTIKRDDGPWFVLADVCRVLGIANVGNAAGRLDADEKDDIGLTDTIGRIQQTIIVNEAGLYRLILRSDKPAAKRFQKWVMSEVLPAIRQTGGYMVAAPDETPEELALRALTVLQATVERQKAQLAVVTPKAEALDRISSADGDLSLTEAAKALQVRPKNFMEFLQTKGWTYRRAGSGTWLGYQDKTNAGYLVHRVHSVRQPDGTEVVREQVKITPRGLTKLANIIPGAQPSLG